MNLPAKLNVQKLQEVMSRLPQVELPTDHYFADGMYCRRLFRPAGCTIVGKVHKKEHFYMVIKGQVAVYGDSGVKIYNPGDVIVSKPGTKRAVYAIEDSVCLTVHRTDSTILDEIEQELIEPDETALFDSSNKAKQNVLVERTES